LCEFDGGRIREPEERSMRNPIKLTTDCRINVRVIVPMNVRPNGGISIDVFATSAVTQHCPVAFGQNQWLMLRGAPLTHVSKRVPDKSLVGFDQSFRIPFSHNSLESSEATTPRFQFINHSRG